MKLRACVLIIFHIITTCPSTTGSSLPEHPSSSSLSSTLSTRKPDSENSHHSECQLVETAVCGKIYTSAQMPNLFGDSSSKVAGGKVEKLLSGLSQQKFCVIVFVCALFLPPCPDNKLAADGADRNYPKMSMPCRQMCELAADEAPELFIRADHSFPISCSTLPTGNCFNYADQNGATFVQTPAKAKPVRSLYEVAKFAPLDIELGNNEDYEVEVVTSSASQVPERRYDIADLGDPDLFQGWADVQGTGAANDYCRVLGKAKRRFLSCNLAGSTGQGHYYVSTLGFEVGLPNTWFMRDMDGDGRDDYCRCVGTNRKSRVTCMKAGEHGFHGGPMQGGNQHTFSLPNSEGCYNKRVNSLFGEMSS